MKKRLRKKLYKKNIAKIVADLSNFSDQTVASTFSSVPETILQLKDIKKAVAMIEEEERKRRQREYLTRAFLAGMIILERDNRFNLTQNLTT